MEEDKKNPLGLDTDDRENLKLVVDDLIDNVVKFNSDGFVKDADLVEFMATLDHASFIINGIVYKHGISLDSWFDEHEHDDEEGVE